MTQNPIKNGELSVQHFHAIHTLSARPLVSTGNRRHAIDANTPRPRHSPMAIFSLYGTIVCKQHNTHIHD